jgi:Tetracyclin repressor-like, C-terminal domain
MCRRLGRTEVDRVELEGSIRQAREIAARYPRLASCIDSPVASYGESAHASFAFGLAAILDGWKARLLRCASTEAQ